MSSNRSPWLIIGPIIGFILLYVIIRYGVTELQTDMAQLDEFGVATLQEVQHAGMAEELEAAPEGDTSADEQAADEEAAVDDAAVEEPTEAEGTEEAESEETTVEEDVVEEDVVEEDVVEEDVAEEATTDEPAADEESTSSE